MVLRGIIQSMGELGRNPVHCVITPPMDATTTPSTPLDSSPIPAGQRPPLRRHTAIRHLPGFRPPLKRRLDFDAAVSEPPSDTTTTPAHLTIDERVEAVEQSVDRVLGLVERLVDGVQLLLQQKNDTLFTM